MENAARHYFAPDGQKRSEADAYFYSRFLSFRAKNRHRGCSSSVKVVLANFFPLPARPQAASLGPIPTLYIALPGESI
jgi:hypothetical protein